jgi:hypothetical protein
MDFILLLGTHIDIPQAINGAGFGIGYIFVAL